LNLSIDELIDKVIDQIPVLLHGKNDRSILVNLARQSVNEYQDRGGFLGEIKITEDLVCDGVLVPGDWIAKLTSYDSQKVYSPIDINEVDDGSGTMVDKIFISEGFPTIAPYTVKYLKNLSEVAEADKVIPVSAAGIIRKHLRILIDIPNNKRLKTMMVGLDHAGHEEIPDETTMLERQSSIELEMDEMNDLLMTSLVM